MGSFTMNVGNVEIVALTDMNCPYPTPLEQLWPGIPAAAWEPFKERYPDTFQGDKMRLEIGCYLIRSQGRVILIDTGYGAGPIDYIGGLRGQLMEDLVSKRVQPGDIDTVFLSHLHLDHVGWNTTEREGRLEPTFPNARYITHRADLEYFRRPEVEAKARYPYMAKFMEPLVRLGMVDAISEDINLIGGVRAIHTPGHTPGHMSILVSSQGQRALIQGDVLIHPAQVTEEEWTPLFDEDPVVALETRRKLLDEVEAEGTTVVSCHFPAPGFGRIVRYDGRRYWQVGV